MAACAPARLNPFVTTALWTPTGSDLVWTTSVPGLALLLAPITLAAGPAAAYNVAAILLPALAATTAFLLCRHLTRSFWPSLAGGYLFGFSSYMLGHELAHLQLTSVFLVPLVALVLLRYLEGALDGGGLVLRLAPLLALQFAFGTEVFFTLALCLAAGLALGALAVASARRRIASSLAPLAGAYGVCAVLVSPLIYYAASDYQGVITPTTHNPVDLVTFAFPTGMAAIGGSLAEHFDPSLPTDLGRERAVPRTAHSRDRRASSRSRAGDGRAAASWSPRSLLAAIATLGSELRIRGQALVPLPWRLVSSAPLFDNVIAARFALYVIARRMPDRRALGRLDRLGTLAADRADRRRGGRPRPEPLARDLARTPGPPGLLHRGARPSLPAARRDRARPAAALPERGAPLAGREWLPLPARRRRAQRRRPAWARATAT